MDKNKIYDTSSDWLLPLLLYFPLLYIEILWLEIKFIPDLIAIRLILIEYFVAPAIAGFTILRLPKKTILVRIVLFLAYYFWFIIFIEPLLFICFFQLQIT